MKADPINSVTIILTTLNSECFVARSIESCLNQTYTDLELVIVDGGSTDRTLEIVGSYDDPRIRVIHQKDNTGKLPGAINLGMQNARGDFITWTQDDCWYEPHAIETMLQFLKAHSDVAFVYTDYWHIDKQGQPFFYWHVKAPDHLLEEDVVGVCFLFRRQVYETIGPQDVRYYSVHELPWRIKVYRQFKLASLHKPLMFYTVHAESLTGRFGGWTEARKATKAIFDEGYIDYPTYIRRLSKIDVDQAYEAFVVNENYTAFWRYMLSGILRDPGWLKNRGLLKLMGASLLPLRHSYQDNLLVQWKQSVAEEQAEMVGEYNQNQVSHSHVQR